MNASAGPKIYIHDNIPETQTAQSLSHELFDHSDVHLDTHDTVPKTKTAQIRPHKIVIDSYVSVDTLTLLRYHFQAKPEKETLRQNTFL